MDVFIHTRSDRQLFNLARLRVNTKTCELCIRELPFADDATVVAHTLEDIKEICKYYEQPYLDLQSVQRKLTLYQPPPGQTSIGPHTEIYGTSLKSAKNFTYLGSTIASDNIINVDINKVSYMCCLRSLWRTLETSMLTTWHYNLHKVEVVITSENFPKCISGI